ncbi:MAG: GNAT family N-acetyltransferase, partial [Bacteroidetes bacterium]|nr:GNAT family N-acetyltransferase [Bacteroidota bacterium]
FATPPELQILGDNDIDIRNIKAVPYSANNHILSSAVRAAFPDRAQRFLALLKRKIVGQSAVFFTEGDYGVAGIYNVGVVPELQNQGIGKALTIAACLYAKERGYRYAVLNASESGRRIYEQLGFTWQGFGNTWWVVGDRWRVSAPDATEISLVEAIGSGAIEQLHPMQAGLTRERLSGRINNGMTLMEVAVHCRQPASAEWLIAQGAPYTLMDAWDLGWKERAAALLAAHPEEVNRRYGEGNVTILHTAVMRNDIALAALALSGRPDLSITDSWHDSAALGWAQYFRRPEIIQMIRDHHQQYQQS